MRIYTRKGDDGTTGLFYGGRVAKDAAGPEAYGAVDEAVAALGVARALAADPIAASILRVQRDLFVLAAELATAPGNRAKLDPGTSLVSQQMVDAIERHIDELVEGGALPSEFVVPGGSPLAAAIDVARATVRRAERRTVTFHRSASVAGSLAVPYLNRLADYLFLLARDAEDRWTTTKGDDDG